MCPILTTQREVQLSRMNIPATKLSLPSVDGKDAVSLTNDNLTSDSPDFATLLQTATQADTQIYMSGLLGHVAPFLGPVGSVAAAAADHALDGNLAEIGGESRSNDQQALMASLESNPLVCRAIVAEAALQTVMEIDSDDSSKAAGLDLVGKMEEYYHQGQQGLAGDDNTSKSTVAATADSQSDFMRAIEEYLRKSERSWFDQFSRAPWPTGQSSNSATSPEVVEFISNVVHVGTSIQTPSHSAITNLFAAATEESPDAPSHQDAETVSQQYMLSQRALLGDAALQSIQALQPQIATERGLLGDASSILKKVGETVIKIAPTVLGSG